MHTKWIVGALAAALWIAPAAAQTGSSGNSAQGNGSDTSRNATETNTKSGSTRDAPGAATNSTNSTGSTSEPNYQPSGGHPGQAGSGWNNSGTGSSTSGSATGAATGSSDTTSSGHPTSSASGASDTASTLAKLHDGNKAEIEAGNWMKDHAQNSKVKDFAKKMVDDHGSMDKDVMSFAQKKNVDLTSASGAGKETAKAERHLEDIKAMSGAQADRAYMDMMVRDHTHDVSEVRQAEQLAKSSQDDDLAKLLDKSAKKMESHLKDAQSIQRDLTQRQARNPANP